MLNTNGREPIGHRARSRMNGSRLPSSKREADFSIASAPGRALKRRSEGSVRAILRSVDLSFTLHFLERLARVSEGIEP
jgi:hypothetical protein